MNEHPDEIFREVLYLHRHAATERERYRQLNLLLTRVVKACTNTFNAEFTHFSARLHALCKTCGLPMTPIAVFRANCLRMQQGSYHPTDEDYRYDLKALCEALSAFCGYPIPEALQALLPARWRQVPARGHTVFKRLRLTVDHWDAVFLHGHATEEPDCAYHTVCYAEAGGGPFAFLAEQLHEGAQVNLLNVQTREVDGQTVLYPEFIVLNPDYLIDITALCACVKPCGYSPYHHLLNKFVPPAHSAAIQMGNVANLFLDECVNEQPSCQLSEDELFMRAMRKSFSETPLEYATLDGIDRPFFDECRRQFSHIRQTVRQRFSAADIDIDTARARLEPSFVCEALGLQGRMDLLVDDLSKIVELKSGKAEEYPSLHPKEEHQLQMALYKEALCFNMNTERRQVQTFLFYSRYPKFYASDLPRHVLQKAIALRNAIVSIEQRIGTGEAEDIIAELKERDFNTSGRTDRFYETYLKPPIMAVLKPLKNMQGTERAYFHTFLSFLQREMILAKTGDDRPDGDRGFAESWNTDPTLKRQNGNMADNLELTPVTDANGVVEKLRMHIRTDDEMLCMPNFRTGDMVMLYIKNNDNDQVTNKEIHRCIIEEIHPDHYLLRLAYKQRRPDVFKTNARYAIEPAHSDATGRSAFAGLFSLLLAPTSRKQLVLGERRPSIDDSRTLRTHHGSEAIDRIVLQAKQANDYFLLVGPPGTGKTSVALKAMVKEFMEERKTLLLMAYTNRAVDEICQMLQTISPEPDYIRIGQELSCAQPYRHHLLSVRTATARNRDDIRRLIAGTDLFVSTVSSMCSSTRLFALRTIDIAIIDEASQVLEPQLLPLLCATGRTSGTDRSHDITPAIGKFILIGDHKQLPAVVAQHSSDSATDNPLLHAIGLTNCRNSLFERLHKLQQQWQTTGIVAMLNLQGRMHPDLCGFVNSRYYNGLLRPIPLPHQEAGLSYPTPGNNLWQQYVATTRLGLVDIRPATIAENNKSNQSEAQAVACLAKAITTLRHGDGETENLSERIGIIVPFRSQIITIRRALTAHGVPDAELITIDTVERYQGSQRDIIIFSTTVSHPYQLQVLSEPTAGDGRSIDRKLNVAITRAREQFFMVGNAALLHRSVAYHDFLCSIPREACIAPEEEALFPEATTTISSGTFNA